MTISSKTAKLALYGSIFLLGVNLGTAIGNNNLKFLENGICDQATHYFILTSAIFEMLALTYFIVKLHGIASKLNQKQIVASPSSLLGTSDVSSAAQAALRPKQA